MDIEKIPMNPELIPGRSMSQMFTVNTTPVRKGKTGLIFVAALATVSCSPRPNKIILYNQPRPQWESEFLRLPLQKQWIAYRYSIQYIRPPPFDLAVILARKRGLTIPFIVSDLKKSQRYSDIEADAAVIQMMIGVYHYNPCLDASFRASDIQSVMRRYSDTRAYSCK